MHRTAKLISVVCLAACVGCAEVVTDGVVGTIDIDVSTSGNDSTSIDRAAAMEGVWLFSDLEGDAVIFAKHIGPGLLRVAWPAWNGSGFVLESTDAVTSVIRGSGQRLLNVNPVYDGQRDSSNFWTILYRADGDLMLLYAMDADYVEGLREVGQVYVVSDTVNDVGRLRMDNEDVEALIMESGWELWDQDHLMILRRLSYDEGVFR